MSENTLDKIHLDNVIECEAYYNCLTAPGKRDIECSFATKKEFKIATQKEEIRQN